MEEITMIDDPTSLIYAYLDGELADSQQGTLVDWLRQDSENLERFVFECRLHSELWDVYGPQPAGDRARGAPVKEPQISKPPYPNSETPTTFSLTSRSSSLVLDNRQPPFSTYSLADSWLFSYTVSLVVTGTLLLVGWVVKTSHHVPGQLATSGAAGSSSSVLADRNTAEEEGVGLASDTPKKMEFVAQVTGMVDCRWDDPSKESFFNGIHVPLGKKFTLASGLVQITYYNGANVILQGPCSYQVDSAHGGYLSLGKLTAKVERSEVRGQRSVKANPKSKIQNPLIPGP